MTEIFKTYYNTDNLETQTKVVCESVEWIWKAARCKFRAMQGEMYHTIEIEASQWNGQFIPGYVYNLSVESSKVECK